MHQYTIIALCLILATSTVAQIPHNLSFEELTAYLPFVSINTDYILNDTRASEQLASAGDNPVTLFLSLNTPFEQYMAEPPPSAAAARVQTAHITDAALTSDTFQYFQIDGIHPSTSFNGTSFLTTRFNDTTYENVTGGAKIEVFRNETAFYVGTGINFKSRVIIPDLEFNGGILHLVDHPMAPPYSLNDTAIVLNIELVPALITSLAPTFPDIQTASDVTVFVPRIGANSGSTGDRVPADFIGTAEYVGSYVVSGEVLYSTNLTAGTHIKTTANTTLIVSRDTNGSISVNGSRIVEPDILTQNGVVHIIEGLFTPTAEKIEPIESPI